MVPFDKTAYQRDYMKRYREKQQAAFVDQCFREMKEKGKDSLKFAEATRVLDKLFPEFQLGDQLGCHMGWALKGTPLSKQDYLGRFIQFLEFSRNTRALAILINRLTIENSKMIVEAARSAQRVRVEYDKPVNSGYIVKNFNEAKAEKEKNFALDVGFNEGIIKAAESWQFEKISGVLHDFLKGLEYVEAAYILKGARHGWERPEEPKGNDVYTVYVK